ncbi:cobalt-precorrin-5B (C(1))-methyltransferase [Oribacterium sp. WCC10]|uniref:cobalt-precorrin-5B (C(1))-methyltransferase n=1 Tax=Oribacterium sp. WCC10 TaxID=1855343 RepID=UPI0008E60E65|nr:cobalt-precorrin-5B (C(1))-methyltransferase [Oribacterium sp. WCC10]SFG73339.1 cobalamin biosynthesis protein CbiD [Oribacterium sp. WCC10]
MFKDNYVFKNQKKMRCGLTTGTCAAACTKAAMEMLLTGHVSKEVSIVLPGGERVSLEVHIASDIDDTSLDSANIDKINAAFGESSSAEHDETCKRSCCEHYEIEENPFDNSNVKAHKSSAFYTIKDAGDDPDVTNGTEIHVEIKEIFLEEVPAKAFKCAENPRLFLIGGRGVGTVTKQGLQQETGESAINPVPRMMIFRAAMDILEMIADDTESVGVTEFQLPYNLTTSDFSNAAGGVRDKKPEETFKAADNGSESDCKSESHDKRDGSEVFLITVSVPDGVELAKKTFNPMLGIEGGISILGTTGIVEPMSEASIVATIETEIRQKMFYQRSGIKSEDETEKNCRIEISDISAYGNMEDNGNSEVCGNEDVQDKTSGIIAVPGNYGKRYAEKLGIDTEQVVMVSNYIGEAIDLAISYGCGSFLLLGNIGKLVKLAAGIMNTHSKVADGRWEIFAAHLAICGGSIEQVRAIKEAATTEEMLTLLEGMGLRNEVMTSIMKEIAFHMEHRIKDKMRFGVIVYSERFGIVGKCGEAGRVMKRFDGGRV